jgi:hypothetical protein
LLDFPPFELIRQDTVVSVSNWAIFFGPDDTSAQQDHAREHLLREIQLSSKRISLTMDDKMASP